MITGKLTNAGTMQVGHEEDRTGIFIDMTETALRSLDSLPMYEPVAVLSLAEGEKLVALERENARLREALTRITEINWGWDGDCGATAIAEIALS